MRSKTFYFLMLFICCIIGLNACRKDTSNTNTAVEQKLTGNWVRENSWDNHLLYYERYNFASNHRIEITGIVIDSAARVSKGYLLKQTGSFTVVGDSLIISNLKLYGSDGIPVNNESDLHFKTTYTRYSQKVAFFEPDLLHLIYPPCGPAANCVGGILLKREQSK